MKRRSTIGSHTGAFAIIFGFIISATAVLFIALLLCITAYKGQDPTARVGLFALVSLTLGGFFGGVGTSRIKGEGGVGCAAILGIGGALILIAMRLIFSAVGASAFLTATTFIGACILGAYLARPRQRRHRR